MQYEYELTFTETFPVVDSLSDIDLRERETTYTFMAENDNDASAIACRMPRPKKLVRVVATWKPEPSGV